MTGFTLLSSKATSVYEADDNEFIPCDHHYEGHHRGRGNIQPHQLVVVNGKERLHFKCARKRQLVSKEDAQAIAHKLFDSSDKSLRTLSWKLSYWFPSFGD